MKPKRLSGFVAAALLALLSAVFTHAQSDGTKIAPGTIVEPAKSFDEMLTELQKEFTSAAEAMPAEKYGFAPPSTNGAKFDGVRTFAQQITHVAQANYNYGSAVGNIKPELDVKALSKLTDKPQVLAALAASFAFVHKAIATLTPQNAFESAYGNASRASLAGGVVAHAFDHYGQIVEYLRMNGIVPPASAK